MANAKIEKTGKGSWFDAKIVVNFVLSAIAVYALTFWYNEVRTLEPLKQGLNLGAVFMIVALVFTATTYFSKGTWNVIKKAIILILMSAITVALVFFSVEVVEDIIYPASGILVAGIGYYMFSLSSHTLRASGITFIIVVISIIILLTYKFVPGLTGDQIKDMIKLGVFLMLYLGGTWAHLRNAWHGIKGVNSDGGGFGHDGAEAGDSSDGDGDTGHE